MAIRKEMWRGLVLAAILLLCITGWAQQDSVPPKPHRSFNRPEIFTSGFIDIVNNGQVSASARAIRLYIGEPGRFAIPVSVYSGVSATSFQAASTSSLAANGPLAHQLINPLSGLINLSSDAIIYFSKRPVLTRAGWLYHLGQRLLSALKTGSAADPFTARPVNFLNSFASSGFYLQTGAWERNNNKNMGISWLALRYHWCYSRPQQLSALLPGITGNGMFTGYSAGFGIEISNLVNLKLVYYKYIKAPEPDNDSPLYQFSFNYTVK